MYCNQCGNLLTEQGAFCSFCGAKNEEAAQNVQPEAQTMPAESISPMTEPAAAYTAPQPAPQMYTIPQPPTGYVPEAPIAPKPPKEEKYYTFNHILLCLAAVAVMAVVAGVFAGLYFSVI